MKRTFLLDLANSHRRIDLGLWPLLTLAWCIFLGNPVLALAMDTTATSPSQSVAAPTLNQANGAEAVKANNQGADYIVRVATIPMRDGIKLYTVIIIPIVVTSAPIVLTRTPYDATLLRDKTSSSMLGLLPQGDSELVGAHYIRVYQDIRGKYRSGGVFDAVRPARGPLNSSDTDETTDAWDTIDWLVKNIPESNGNVGMIGSSYDGFEVAMALLDPHPALKAAVAECPIINLWMGDDWSHYGAFRQKVTDALGQQAAEKSKQAPDTHRSNDDYETYAQAGSAGAYARAHGFSDFPRWRARTAHPAYDTFWQQQALDKLIAAHPSSVPTIWEQGLWDEEDIWGANHTWSALKAVGHASNNWLVLGPWSHGQATSDGSGIGAFSWPVDSAAQFRHDTVVPFFEQYLNGGPDAKLARATVYNPAKRGWQTFSDWPPACEHGCTYPMKALYLQSDFRLSFEMPDQPAGEDSYVSDPDQPVPYTPRPANLSDAHAWQTWLVHDQRFVDGRTDVLVYQTAPLKIAVKIAGAPIADLIAKTTGTDADFVVKLIDVYPLQYPAQPDLGGYELPIALDIFRGRYRDSFEHPSPIPANLPQHYRFVLPNQNYVFLPGHRIMVQIQSTLFPLYDRNPQTYVDNIFLATYEDYKRTTISISHSLQGPSAIWLPIVP